MYDKDDHFGRWVQLICAVPLVLVGGALLYISHATDYFLDSDYYGKYGVDSFAAACLVLAVRCLWYAATGKDNVNKDI